MRFSSHFRLPAIRPRSAATHDPLVVAPLALLLVATLTAAPSGTRAASWRMLSPGTPGWSAAAAWDAPRSRFLAVGDPSAVFALQVAPTPAWSALRTSGAAPPAGSPIVHDPVHERLIAFSAGAVWTLPLSGPPIWTATTTGGAAPTQCTVAYDPVRDRVLAFAGVARQMLALTLGPTPSWSVVGSGGPAARTAAAMTYDPSRDCLVVFGGRAPSTIAGASTASGRTAQPSLIGTFFNDTWTFSLASNAWAPLLPPGTLPSARSSAAIIYDAPRDRLVLYGGAGGDNLVWSMPMEGTQPWFSSNPAGPGIRYGHTLTADGAGGAYLFGGGDLSATWRLDLATDTWAIVQQPSPFIPGRSGAAGVFDPSLRLLAVACGSFGVNALGDTWQLDVDGSPLWQQLSSGPTSRMSPSAVFDPGPGTVLLFGGWDGSHMLSDTWSLTLGGGTWQPMSSGGSAPSREGHVAVFDPVVGDMIVFGGVDASGMRYNDLYRRGADNQWSPIAAGGTPPSPRMNACGIYDPARRRMLIFGGNTDAPYPNLSNEVWALSLDGTPTWSKLSTSGAPSPREQAGAVYDAAGDRMIVFGGESNMYLNEVWALPLGAPAIWQGIVPTGPAPAPRSAAVVTIDPVQHQLLVFGGGDLADAWALPLAGGETVAVADPPTALRLGPAFPNPSRGDVRLSLELPARARVTGEVVDLAGRRVARLIEGALEAGPHAIVWDGRAAEGRGVPAGLYFMRVRVGGTSMTRRVVHLD